MCSHNALLGSILISPVTFSKCPTLSKRKKVGINKSSSSVAANGIMKTMCAGIISSSRFGQTPDFHIGSRLIALPVPAEANQADWHICYKMLIRAQWRYNARAKSMTISNPIFRLNFDAVGGELKHLKDFLDSFIFKLFVMFRIDRNCYAGEFCLS